MTRDDLEQLRVALMMRMNEVLKTASRGRPTTVLWHYTNPDAFLKIVEFGTLRGSHIRFMNDEKEYVHSIQHAVAEVDTALAVSSSADSKALLKEMRTFFEMGLDLEKANALFVASFSQVRDDLSQWRAYGGPEGGISIGFSVDGLVNRIAKNGLRALLTAVEYDDANQQTIAKEIVATAVAEHAKALVRDPKLSASDYALMVNDQATIYAAITKDDTFKAEEEVRLVRYVEPADLSAVKFWARNSMVAAAWDFDLKDKTTQLLPIVEVVVGPGRMAAHSAAAVKALLEKLGYGKTVKVDTSGVPYRVVK